MYSSEARHQQFLAELSAATQTLSEPTDVMQTSARLLAEHLDVDRCAYAPVEDERVFNITGDYTRGGVPSIVGDWDVAAFGPGCVSAMLAGEPFVVDDTDRDSRIGPDDLPAYRATTIRSVVCVPLHKQGRFTAAMAVHRNKPWRWSADEIELVTIVVARCWEALERVRVTRNLRESEERYRAMVEATPECVKLVGSDGTLLQMNAAGLRMLEIDDEGSAIGSNVSIAIRVFSRSPAWICVDVTENARLYEQLREMHGGSVCAESPGIGQGSTFTVKLPLAMRDVRPAAGAATEGISPGARQPRRILVVDDNVDAAETLAMLLELGGNTTRLAHDGRAALEVVSEFRPELVFLDIGLPGMNGYEVAARVRADPAITQPVLVALTGWGSEEDRKQAHIAGFDRHLVKPIDSAKLEAILAATRT